MSESKIEKFVGRFKDILKEIYLAQRERALYKAKEEVLATEIVRLSEENAELWGMLDELQKSDEAIHTHVGVFETEDDE